VAEGTVGYAASQFLRNPKVRAALRGALDRPDRRRPPAPPRSAERQAPADAISRHARLGKAEEALKQARDAEPAAIVDRLLADAPGKPTGSAFDAAAERVGSIKRQIGGQRARVPAAARSDRLGSRALGGCRGEPGGAPEAGRDPAVLRDLIAFSGPAWSEAVASGGEFDIPALGGGVWRGAVMVHERRPTLAVRTFVVA
jgi:hypothetical protein